MPDSDLREELKRNGWQQGSILSGERAQQIISSSIITFEWRREDMAILVSQDCDVLNDAETMLEFIKAVPIADEDVNKNHLHGRSIRQLFVMLDESYYQLNIMERFWVKRSALHSFHADNLMAKNVVSKLSTWLSLRYNRAALPDEFNKRIKPAASWLIKRLGRLKRKDADQLLGFYLNVETDEDLSSGEAYDMSLLVLVSAGTNPTVLTTMKEMIHNFVGRIEKTGTRIYPEIANDFIQPDDQITVADIRAMTRWSFEELSVKTKETPSETLRTLN